MEVPKPAVELSLKLSSTHIGQVASRESLLPLHHQTPVDLPDPDAAAVDFPDAAASLAEDDSAAAASAEDDSAAASLAEDDSASAPNPWHQLDSVGRRINIYIYINM